MIVIFVLLLCDLVFSVSSNYSPNWNSLDSRQNPGWWSKTKFSIFMHWGLYSVPSYCSPTNTQDNCYAEWYGNLMNQPDNPIQKFHNQTYGPNFKYAEFAPLFKCELFDPDEWADIFLRSGATGLIVTSKHHEGYAMWGSAQSWNFNSVDTGPHKDLMADLSNAVRKKGLTFGMYYSLYEWFHPLYLGPDPQLYVDQVMVAQLKDIVTRYQPDVLYADGEWNHNSDFWKTKEFLAWLFNDSPVKDKVVINDRWGNETRGKHGGIYICEYSAEVGGSCITTDPLHPWSAHEGMGKSFGYNRIDEYKDSSYFVSLLIQSVAYGGHLQLNVGPTADGRIPDIQKQILLQMGEWLKVNGEAIYNTTGYPFGISKACIGESGQPPYGVRTCFTRRGYDVYSLFIGWPKTSTIKFNWIKPSTSTVVSFLGNNPSPLQYTYDPQNGLEVHLPPFSFDDFASLLAFTLKITNLDWSRAASNKILSS